MAQEQSVTSDATDNSLLERHRGKVKVLNRIASDPLALGGLIYILILILVAVFAPVVAPYDPTRQDYQALTEPPSVAHPFGTDTLGRDVLSRVIFGSRYAVFLGIVIVGIQMVIGVSLGLIAGYYGGLVESFIMRLVDISLSIPGIVLALAIAGMLGGGLVPLIIAVSLIGWRGFARLVRGDALSVMEEEYIEAAKSSGVSDFRVITKYILPNAASSVIVYGTLTIPSIILWSAGLSFLGMGVQPPRPEWGAIIAAGRGEIDTAWWISTFPGLTIMLTVMAFNFLGDGLRDAIDPRSTRLR